MQLDHEDWLVKELMKTDMFDSAVNNVRANFQVTAEQTANPAKLKRILDHLRKVEAGAATGGMEKWFSEQSEFPITALPKHKAFFDAGGSFSERLALSGNRQ